MEVTFIRVRSMASRVFNEGNTGGCQCTTTGPTHTHRHTKKNPNGSEPYGNALLCRTDGLPNRVMKIINWEVKQIYIFFFVVLLSYGELRENNFPSVPLRPGRFSSREKSFKLEPGYKFSYEWKV